MEPAWDLAARAADRAGIELRALSGMADLTEVERLAGAVWGDESTPPHLLRALEAAGSPFYGAADAEGRTVGFVFGFLGLAGGLHLHSHMLGVLPDWRSRGVGYALKLAQRAGCLDLGVSEVRWTFDPLVARNGRFNLCRLGTVAWRWLPHFYGEMTDRINRGDRSDRFEVRWSLNGERVGRALGGGLEEPPEAVPLLEVGPGERPVPHPDVRPSPGCTVAVPRDHLRMRRDDPALGHTWREAAAAAFDACFGAGLVAGWITEDGRYVFEEATA